MKSSSDYFVCVCRYRYPDQMYDFLQPPLLLILWVPSRKNPTHALYPAVTLSLEISVQTRPLLQRPQLHHWKRNDSTEIQTSVMDKLCQDMMVPRIDDRVSWFQYVANGRALQVKWWMHNLNVRMMAWVQQTFSVLQHEL